MSEYQYYEFQAIDRRLTDRELRALRDISTRASITPTSFTNFYTFGDLKADPRVLVEKYFDAFLYFANWRTYELMFRLPRRLLDPDVASRYFRGESASVRQKGEHLILHVWTEDEDGDGACESDGEGLLSSIAPVRADLARGDLRMPYLAWLLCAQKGEFEDTEVEPPVPPGLGQLTPSLEAFADFLRIDPDLVTAAATASPRASTTAAPSAEAARRIASLAEEEKTALLARVLEGDPHVGTELERRFTGAQAGGAAARDGSRSVAELLEAAHAIATDRRRVEAERRAKELARREREKAAAREKHLADLATQAPAAWRRVEMLIETKQPSKYDEAVTLLRDLREISVRAGRADEADDRIGHLACRNARKVTLIERLSRAGFRVSMAGAR